MTLKDAIKLAAEKHSPEQLAHVMLVWTLTQIRGYDEDHQILAMLHDLIEDTDVSSEDLRGSLKPEVLEALLAITRSPAETYFEYIERVSKNQMATTIKLVDLNINLARSRNAPVIESLTKRYQKALDFLTEGR